MTDAPERITAWGCWKNASFYSGFIHTEETPDFTETEYIRADIHQAEVAAAKAEIESAVAAALREASNLADPAHRLAIQMLIQDDACAELDKRIAEAVAQERERIARWSVLAAAIREGKE